MITSVSFLSLSPSIQYYVVASLKLEHLVKCPSLPYADIHFILSNLARTLSEALDNGETIVM